MDNLKTIFTKKDIQTRFNISFATVNNWIKTGIIPSPTNGSYTNDVYNFLISSIETNENKLKVRANRSNKNKTEIIFLGIKDKERKELLIKLVEQFKNSNLSIMEAVFSLAKQILIDNGLYDEDFEICRKINKNYNGINIFQNYHIKNKNDDILGAFYQSIQSISSKSKNGSFYTPAEILSLIKIPANAKVLDPCCGSGSILINTLSKQHNPSNIYAFDIDEIALLICHINLILFFNDANITPHIEKHDLFFPNETASFNKDNDYYDFIVTNPPWGSKLSKDQKDFLLKQYPTLDTTEVFSIALYNSIHKLSKKGLLIFFLPESILNVSAHKNIRRFLLECKRDIEILPLGMSFKGVQSECILLKLSGKVQWDIQIKVKEKNEYNLDISKITAPNYFISYMISDFDNKILNKIYCEKSTKLPMSTKFALGIVTGNNKRYVHTIQLEDEQAIFRGKDILPYKLKLPECFIKFRPTIFQQVAPVEMYRSKKIVYKFISDKIVCAIDEGSLVLNSANIIISKDYQMEILVCLFNSPIYTFIYQKKFKSKKVLRQHFQDFPLPILCDDLVKSFNELYMDIIRGTKTQDNVDKMICSYFKISVSEYNHIRASVYGNA